MNSPFGPESELVGFAVELGHLQPSAPLEVVAPDAVVELTTDEVRYEGEVIGRVDGYDPATGVLSFTIDAAPPELRAAARRSVSGSISVDTSRLDVAAAIANAHDDALAAGAATADAFREMQAASGALLLDAADPDRTAERVRHLANHAQAVTPGHDAEHRFAWTRYTAAGGSMQTPWQAYKAGLEAAAVWAARRD